MLFVSIQWGLESAGRFGWLSRTILVGLKAGASLKEASSHLICSCKCNMQHLMGACHIPILKNTWKKKHINLWNRGIRTTVVPLGVVPFWSYQTRLLVLERHGASVAPTESPVQEISWRESSDEEVRGLTFSMIVCVGISEMIRSSRV